MKSARDITSAKGEVQEIDGRLLNDINRELPFVPDPPKLVRQITPVKFQVDHSSMLSSRYSRPLQLCRTASDFTRRYNVGLAYHSGQLLRTGYFALVVVVVFFLHIWDTCEQCHDMSPSVGRLRDTVTMYTI